MSSTCVCPFVHLYSDLLLLCWMGFIYFHQLTTIWASTRESLSSVFANNKSHRPACALVQSGQRLCYCIIQICFEQNFNFLASLCSWTDRFESRSLCQKPKDKLCYDEAYIWYGKIILKFWILSNNMLVIRAGIHKMCEGAQWLSGRVLDLRLRGHGFEPHWCHCVVFLNKTHWS